MMPAPSLAGASECNAGASPESLLIDEEQAALTLDQCGVIRDCNEAGAQLFGYRRAELIRQHVSLLLPQLADVELLKDGRLNDRLRFLCSITGYFQGLRRSGERFASDLFLLDLFNSGCPDLRMIVRRDQPELIHSTVA